MIQAVMIDDEPDNNRVLKKILEEFCPDVHVCGEAFDAAEGQKVIEKWQPDLVFLDIEMPYGNAFDLLDRMKPVKFEIIFITAFNDYMLKAFRYSALDYLLKPLNIEELRLTVDKVRGKVKQRNTHQQLETLLANLRQSEPGAYKLALPSLEGLIFVRFDKIVRCEASGGYTIFHMTGGEQVLSTKNIKDYEAILPVSMFMRVHHSHLINLLYIKKYHKGRGGYIEMDDQAMIEVASRRKSEFLSRFGF